MSSTTAVPSLEKYLSENNSGLDELVQKVCAEQNVSATDKVELSMAEYISGKLAAARVDASARATAKLAEHEEVLSSEHPIRGAKVQAIVKKVIQEKILCDANPAIDLFDMANFKNRVDELLNAFDGVKGVHALAVKSNPIRGVLREAKLKGLGAECASYPEAKHSLSLGFEPRKVIYDTPCKTVDELHEMMTAGCYINLDNLDEIEKVNEILKNDSALTPEVISKQIGLRINPVVGGGAISSTSTATASSKFGLPLTPETAEEMHGIFKANPWLQGVHVHVGSQGCAMQMLVSGAARAVEFAEKTNERLGRNQIQVIDIGGGMPTLYNGISEAHSFTDYVSQLKEQIPALFSGKFEILTEFGRSMFVKSGITVTKVEAVKTWCGQRQAVVHVGANQFLRTAYLPTQWRHCMSVFDSNGNLKSNEKVLKHDIAGPMCFSGDFLGKGILLPEIVAGDYLVIHDTGGYTTAMYSKYNSRRASAMYAYDEDLKLSVLKDRETCEETLQFWGYEVPKPL